VASGFVIPVHGAPPYRDENDRTWIITRYAEPALRNGFIDEVLRFAPPATRIMSRRSKVDIELSGVAIPANARMDIDVAGVHRDPRAYPYPESFNVERKGPPLLTFGSGVHGCVGVALARTETRVVLNYVLSNFAVHAAGEAQRIEDRDFWGYKSLPLLFTKLS
jgi:cytochrome P450